MYRIFQGDVLFRDEYNLTMISAYMWMPIFVIYYFFRGTVGIYLFFRNIYSIISFLVAVFLLSCFKKNNLFTFLGALSVLLYSRANISGVSYYNSSMIFWLLSALIIYKIIVHNRNEYIYYVILGIAMSCAVLSNPYTIIGAFVGIVVLALNKRKRVVASIITISLLAIGVLINFALHLSYRDIYIYFNDVPLAAREGLLKSCIGFFGDIYYGYKNTLAIEVCICICNLLINKYTKKRKRLFSFLSFTVTVTCFICDIIRMQNCLGMANLSLLFVGLQLYPLYYERLEETVRREVLFFWGAGGLLAFCTRLASNCHLDSMGLGFAIATIGTFIFIGTIFGDEQSKGYNYRKIVLGIMIVLSVANTAFLRFFAVYRDATLDQLTCRIERGPSRGLYTTSEHLEQYNNMMLDIEENIDENDDIFISKLAPWAYLCTKARCDAPSTWRTQLDDPSLEIYYQSHVLPSKVLVIEPEYGGFVDNYIPTWGEQGDLFPNANCSEGWFIQTLLSNGYKAKEVRSGILYYNTEVAGKG